MRRIPAAALIAAGVLMLQVGWLFAIPAFGGIDEFDHAYRAASVARGHVSPPLSPNTTGPGDLIPVPRDLVIAARNRCSDLPYTGFDNCHAESAADQDGQVNVASTAARYNPAYPLIVGAAALPFDGSSALYAMRIMTIVLCDALLVASWWVTGRASRTIWPRVAGLIAITPVMLYATANAAPNGVQMCAGLLMWSAGLALARTGPQTAILWTLALSTMVVLTVHSTGPMWVAIILATLALWPRAVTAARESWRDRRSTCLKAVTAIGIVAAADVLWSISRSTNLNWQDREELTLTAGTLLDALPLWALQTIGSVPFRNEYLPAPVFMTWLVVFALLCAAGARYASWRQRGVMSAIVLLFFAVPVPLTVISFDQLGLAWQGRYALPLVCGLPLLAGWVLEDAQPRAKIVTVLQLAIPLAFCAAQSMAVWAVSDRQGSNWPPAHTLDPLPAWLLATLCLGATAAMFLGFVHLMTQRLVRAAHPTPPVPLREP